ncbi:MAG TPA: efflux RND transporter periplasmic adaptor subunit, partial [Saprospiraceae bacterium]|nr:efflux RND transporter periplasmic adaptor subunit [Saprospiraceae bacterium]
TVEDKIYRPDLSKKVLVEADTVTSRVFQKTFSYTGTFLPNKEAMIIPQLQGQVRSIHFDEGELVHEGKLLVQMDDDLYQAQRLGAEANFQTAERTAARYDNAQGSGGVSGLQVDNSKLTVKTTESQLKQINKQISMSRITAPFTGTITMRDVEVGSVIGGRPIAQITDLSRLKLEIFVPEKEVIHCHLGDPIAIETNVYPGLSLTGHIDYIADRGDNAHNYLVRIVVVNNFKAITLKAGMYGTAILNKDLADHALAIPRTALLGSAKSPQVFVIEQDSAVLKDIQIGQVNDEFVEVLSGLHQGDVVITSGHINLSNGSGVQVAQHSTKS